MIKLVIFDLGKVLVLWKGHLIDRAIAEELGISVRQFTKLTKGYLPRVQVGKSSLLEMYGQIAKKLGKGHKPTKLIAKHLSAYIRTSTGLDHNVLTIINRMKNKARVICFSNQEPEITEYWRKRKDLFEIFDKAYNSPEIGLRKPTRKGFQHVLIEEGYKPDEALFIDDVLENVKAAKSMGMHVILYKNSKQLKNELVKLELI
ncbi:MAG: HAD family phosphatase [Candidatus Woesearchaeota archaeon]